MHPSLIDLTLQDQTLCRVCDVQRGWFCGEEHRPAGQGPVVRHVPGWTSLPEDTLSWRWEWARKSDARELCPVHSPCKLENQFVNIEYLFTIIKHCMGNIQCFVATNWNHLDCNIRQALDWDLLTICFDEFFHCQTPNLVECHGVDFVFNPSQH